MNPTATLTAIITLAAAANAQNNGLLYSTLNQELSSQCAATPALNTVRPNEIEYLEPVAGPPLIYPYEAKAYLPSTGSNTVAGDSDCDGAYFEPTMFGRIDAIVHPKSNFGVNIRSNKSHVFFSPSTTFTDQSGTSLLPGDVGRLLPQVGGPGTIEHFVHEADLRAAFGVPPSAPFNVDACCIVLEPATAQLGLMLSLEQGVDINVPPYGTTFVEDGAILFIPGPDINWSTAADGAQIILPGDIVPASGWIAAREADVNLWVANSNISDASGACISMIGDVDGLTPDPLRIGWQSAWSPFRYPDLLICGDDPTDPTPGLGLSGAGIVSTLNNGSIGVINARPLGEACPLPTSGEQVGLVTSAVGSLAGLSVVDVRTPHFSMDTMQEVMLAPGVLTMEIGGGSPFNPPPVVLWSLGANAVCGFDPGSASLPNPDFSVLYPTNFFGSAPPVGVDGCTTVSLPIPAALFVLLLGQAIEWQGAQIDVASATWHLTNPARTRFF